jgi:nicotinate phosphoribosyltransferase
MVENKIKILELDFSESALSTDFYELTMAAAYFKSQQSKKRAIFELFVRKLPRNRSYMVAAGLEHVLIYLNNLRFNKKEISFLKSNKSFRHLGKDFFQYLKKFKFTGDVWAVPEGSILFPNEPILRVEGPIIEAQIVETFLLSMINFQSLIATKASRITDVAGSRGIVEFGSRRAHGPQAAVLAARASYIGGCMGTSNTLAGYKFGIPTFGTMAHSYVMSFEKEIDSFKEFNQVFPEGMLLVDTYDSLEAVKKIVKSGMKIKGIRLDSGDLHMLSVESRKILDDAGLKDTKIMASGDLDENIIADLIGQNSPIDIFGVGTELATSRDDPAMNGVYKLVAIKTPVSKNKYEITYKLKTSTGKKTYPASKQIYRIFSNGIIQQDIVGLDDEKFKAKKAVPLLKKVMSNGKISHKLPSLDKIQDFHISQRNTLPKEFRIFNKIPESFPVSYSEKLETITREFRPQ